MPAKWDMHFQRAKESLKKGNINKAPERLNVVDFSVWVNRKSLLYLEKKKHYFEKSPSLDKFKSDVGNSIIDGPEREEFLRQQILLKQKKHDEWAMCCKEHMDQYETRSQELSESSEVEDDNGDPSTVFKIAKSLKNLDFL